MAQKGKTRTKRAAMQTAKATPVNIRRAGAKTVAAAIASRGPAFWADVLAEMPGRLQAVRAAQVEPSATH
jgi:hypothetical protein